MEFEILENEDLISSPFEAVRRFILNPRRQMQVWGEKVPGFAAGAVLGLVVVEWVISSRLVGGHGRGLSTLGQAFSIVAIILVVEGLFTAAGASIASLAGKAGHRRLAIGYFNLGLAPLLLVLPLTLLCLAADAPEIVRLAVIGLLLLKVLGIWRDALEVSFKLNRLQSSAAMYAAVSGSLAVALLLFYVSAVGRIAAALR